ncbi:MAG: 50S ribosomal protein L15 [Candidatus Omnitrophica bacterium]|nr:50S ribosomal protein L15 [Candidatus Omnitrophota bacterium]
MHLHELKSPVGSRKRKKLLGRGAGSGHGRTSGRGQKGQNSRSSGRKLVGTSEGGQMPLAKRLPKVGFRSKRPVLNQVVDLKQLDQLENGTVINAAFLKSQGLIESIHKPFKILGDGELKKSVVIEEGSISLTAREKILKAGGKVPAA